MVTKQATDDQLESWHNAGQGRIFLKKFDSQGHLTDEQVQGGRTVHLTPAERRINQEMAATEDLDVFMNGRLTPVRLLESEADAREIAENPNLLSESAMLDLFKAAPKAFAAKLGQITNVVTLQRFVELAREGDATVRQVDAIRARIEELDPKPAEPASAAPARGSAREPASRGVTPV